MVFFGILGFQQQVSKEMEFGGRNMDLWIWQKREENNSHK
jgi:hypothetical protein